MEKAARLQAGLRLPHMDDWHHASTFAVHAGVGGIEALPERAAAVRSPSIESDSGAGGRPGRCC